MHLNRDYKLRKIAGRYYLISADRAAGPDSVIQLTETAAWILSAVEGGIPREKMASGMTKEFEVDEDTAEMAVQQFLDVLASRGILEYGSVRSEY